MKVLLILGVFVLCGLAYCEEEEDTENELEDASYYPPRCYYKNYCRVYKRCYRKPYCYNKKICNRYVVRYARTCKKVCKRTYYYKYGRRHSRHRCRRVCKYNKPIYKYGCRYFRKCHGGRRYCKKYRRCYRKRVCRPRRRRYDESEN